VFGVAATIDPTSDRPVFKQIADGLRTAILSGALAPGARLPSEQELIDGYGVARGTIRQAVNLLRSEGLVRTEHGRGSYVRDRPPVRRLAHDRFARRHRERGRAAYLAELEAEGRRPEVQVMEIVRTNAPDEVAVWLQLSIGADVLVRRRRYLADGEPMELATSYIPWELATGTPMTETNTGPGGVYARLEERGHRLKRFSEEVAARMPTAEETRALLLQPGVPVFRVVRVAYDVDERPVEACDTVMAADRYVLSYELPAR
jgi:GntR family transcriptional regulator